jgi:beta-glucosidase-like glycosyl hydrolase
VKTVGRVSAYEAADDGLNMTWAPMVDVSTIRAGAVRPKALVKILI